jgi:molecular chaperone Hsp33
MARNLIALGREDLTELAESPDGIELSCHFCGRTYHFAQAELIAISGQEQEEV